MQVYIFFFFCNFLEKIMYWEAQIWHKLLFKTEQLSAEKEKSFPKGET
jgi:hypothetical protein